MVCPNIMCMINVKHNRVYENRKHWYHFQSRNAPMKPYYLNVCIKWNSFSDSSIYQSVNVDCNANAIIPSHTKRPQQVIAFARRNHWQCAVNEITRIEQIEMRLSLKCWLWKGRFITINIMSTWYIQNHNRCLYKSKV